MVTGAVEVEVGNLELELGLACWGGGALLVFGDKAEVGLARQTRIGHVGPSWQVDESAAGYEPGARIVDNYEFEVLICTASVVVSHCNKGCRFSRPTGSGWDSLRRASSKRWLWRGDRPQSQW